jgi:hypothetical protein
MVIKKLSSIALVAIVIVLAGVSLSYAAPHGGHGVAGHPPAGHFGGHPPIGHFPGHPPFVPHPGFHGRTFVRGPHVGVFLGAPFYVPPAYPYYYPPAYTYEPAPSYWYYCPSYGQYYPNVSSCPEPWVPVPAQ